MTKYLWCSNHHYSLFQSCEKCHQAAKVSLTINGTLLRVNQHCTSCSFTRVWFSQPVVNDIPVGNIRLSAAILTSGLLPTKAIRMFHFMKCVTISQSTFFQHQRSFIEPTITNTWREEQDKIVQQLQSNVKPLSLEGDAQCDSPGFSAKYGSYTVMDLKENLIIDIQLVQVCNMHYDALSKIFIQIVE